VVIVIVGELQRSHVLSAINPKRNKLAGDRAIFVNQEDSIIMNQSAIERGLFYATTYKTLTEEEKNTATNCVVEICVPPLECRKNKTANYLLLDEHGLVRKRINGQSVWVEQDDVIVGKVSRQTDKNGEERITDCSRRIAKGEAGYVDRVLISTTPGGLKMVKVVIRIPRIPEIGDKFACYDIETEVLTQEGWKYMGEISPDDHVACLVDRKRLEYLRPTEVQEYAYEGDMYHVDSCKVNLMVTPNHRMFTGSVHRKNYKMQEAREIHGKARSYRINVDEWEPENPASMFRLPGYEELPELDLDMEAWCLFFGIWMAEGCYHISSGGIYISANKQRVKDTLDKVCDILGFNVRKHLERGERNKYWIGDRRVGAYFQPLSVGAINKSLPEWCFNLDMHHSRKLIEGMILGDDCYMKGTTKERYYTSSVKLRDDFQRLCIHAGWGCNYYLKSEARTESTCLGPIMTNADYWSLTVCKTQPNPLVNKYKHKKQQDSWVPYDGPVYCCTVPTDDGIILVRRRGKPVWCGNSRSAQKGTVGMVYKQHDMPYMQSGLIPDLIINPHCLSGDTIIELADGDVTYIKDLYDKEATYVTTVDPATLEKGITTFSDGFVKKAETLVRITTSSGRVVKCTPEHLLLVMRNGSLIWTEARGLYPYSDKMVVTHSLIPVTDIGGELPTVTPGIGKYWDRLKEIGLTGQISLDKAKILARLIGAIDSDSHLRTRNENTGPVRCCLHVGEMGDYDEICRDMRTLGCKIPSACHTEHCYRVELEVSLGVLVRRLGACIGNNVKSKRIFPEWLKIAPMSVQREFLSGYHGGDGSKIGVNKKTVQQQVRIRGTRCRSNDKEALSHRAYLQEIAQMSAKFGIKTTIQCANDHRDNTHDFTLAYSTTPENLIRISDILGYRYCNHKRRESVIAIEYLRSRQHGLQMSYEIFQECFGYGDTGAVLSFVRSVEEIPGELVYDFTTLSANHSFVANGIVSHNCIPSQYTA